jgi:glycosyltransferase involved in cell wall biosynthesis
MSPTLTDRPSCGRSVPNCRSALHVVHGVFALDVGGLERIVLDLVRAGCCAGHRVSVVCVERRGTLASEIERLSGQVISLDKPAGCPSETIRRASTLLAELKPDVLHTHHIGALWYLGQAARLQQQIPVLHTEHGNRFRRETGWMNCLKARLLVHRAARFSTQICCVSDEIADVITRWRSVPRHKVSVVSNGIDADAFADRSQATAVRQELGIADHVPVIGTVGRLNEVKQQELLLRAASRLSSRFPNLHVLLVGDGPERARLETETVRLGLGDRVHFAGHQSRTSQFYQAFDVFTLTSRSEGFPVALLEAWATGLPVVCSAVGGIPRIVTDGMDGLLFPSGNLSALCSSLNALLSDQCRAQMLGRAGQSLVRRKYSLEQMASDYDRRYRHLIAEMTGSRCEFLA